MAVKRLIFHIGTQKTGTSSFQKSLQGNARELIRRGLRPIREQVPASLGMPQRTRANVAGISHLFIRPELLTIARARGAVRPITPSDRATEIEKVAARIARAEDDAVLLSSEAFCFLRSASEKSLLQDFIDRTDRTVEAIVVFRNLADWRSSWNNQLDKNPLVRDRLAREPFQSSIRGDWYFDKDAIRAFWKPLGLSEISYEESSNIVEDLYRAMGISVDGLKTDFFKNQRVDLPEGTQATKDIQPD